MANVRIWGYRAVVQLNQRQTQFFNSDSQFVREEPYLWQQKLALNGATPVETTVNANDEAKMVFVEVDPGVRVRYEVNPNGPAPAITHKDASTTSPPLTGENVFQWFKGATMSFVDASAV